jgi:PiT family inorganic phosphate transporter
MENSMSATTVSTQEAAQPSSGPQLDGKPHKAGAFAFLLVLVAGLGYAAFSIGHDINQVGEHGLATGTLVLLGLALVVALGFEFVNGFHDTANAVATVIYTHSLPPLVAVVWSGTFNFLGVLTSSGAVAFTVVTLLPVELILQAGSGAGYAMIFALLIAAVIWNLGTWAMGLPNSSSHALIGSIMGVGLANQWLAPAGSATSGVDWAQAMGSAVQPADRLRAGGRTAAGHEARAAQQVALRGAEGQHAAAHADPRFADPNLHRRIVLPR